MTQPAFTTAIPETMQATSAAKPLAGRVVLITGASSGLGVQMARAGAHVVLAARHRDRLEAVAGEIPHADAVEAD